MHHDIDDVLALAAMSDTFDPQRLIDGVAATGRDAALEALARDSTEVEREGRYVWRTTAAGRRSVLKGMTRERVQQVLAGVPHLDALGRAFLQVAQVGDELPGAGADVGALYDAVELLRLADTPMTFDVEKLSRRLRIRLNREAAEAALGALLRSPLRGRRRELALLLGFVADGIPALDTAAQSEPRLRGFRRIDGTRPDDVRALLVTGIGGIGKSALIAAGIRRLRGPSWSGRVVVHFDFDMPSLKAGNPAALTLELARQIALARPALDDAMSQSRERLHAAIVDAERQTSGGYDKLQTTIASVLSSWSSAEVHAACNNLVVVLDTIEEVAVLDPGRIGALFDWLGTMRTLMELPALHVVAVGRAIGAENDRSLVGRHFDAELRLADLTAGAARRMLRDLLDRQAPDLAHRAADCVARFGGNPLVLKILANYAQDRTAQDFDDLLAEADATKGSRIDGEFAQKYLYTRLLDRLRDAAIKPLAFPGLVLRRVTPALVCDVLAGPCELGPIDRDQAATLLRRLEKQVWLVLRDGDDGVRHRPDVRRLMLPQVLRGPTTLDKARAVNAHAAAWYEQQATQLPRTDPLRLESWYHRALLDEPLDDLDKTDLIALADHLGEDVADLPARIVSRVRHAQDRSLSGAEIALLPEAEREAAQRRRTRRLANEGLESVAAAATDDALDGDAPGLANGSGLPSWRWCAPDAELPDPEFFKARFAAGEFERVAEFLPTLYVDLLRRMRAAEPSQVSDPLDEPLYLSAIAARAVAPPVGMAELGDLARPAERVAKQYTSPRIDFTLFDDLALCKAMLEGNRISRGFEPIVAQVRTAWENRVAKTPGQWRQLLAHLLNTPDFAIRTTVQLGNLPFLSNKLLIALSNEFATAAADLRISIEPVVAAARRYAGDRRDNAWEEVIIGIAGPTTNTRRPLPPTLDAFDASLQGVDIFASCANAVAVTLRVPTPYWRPPADMRYLGLTPEFYGPARTALQSMKSLDPLREAIDEVAATTAFWPRELASSGLKGSRLYSQIPVVLRVADCFGTFGRLLQFVAQASPPGAAILKTVQVYRAFESVWKL